MLRTRLYTKFLDIMCSHSILLSTVAVLQCGWNILRGEDMSTLSETFGDVDGLREGFLYSPLRSVLKIDLRQTYYVPLFLPEDFHEVLLGEFSATYQTSH